MSIRKAFLSIILLSLSFEVFSQNQNSKHLVEEALKNKNIHNVINDKNIILKDSTAAISIAEIALFEIYDKKNIIQQRPYSVSLVDNSYWVISGTLPKGYLGGTFLIIIDAKNCQIIRVTHGK